MLQRSASGVSPLSYAMTNSWLGYAWDKLLAGEELPPGQCLENHGRTVRLCFEPDGNLVLLVNTDGKGFNKQLWKAEYLNHGSGAPFKLQLQEDGNLVIFDKDSNGLWASDTADGAMTCRNNIQVDDSIDGLYLLVTMISIQF